MGYELRRTRSESEPPHEWDVYVLFCDGEATIVHTEDAQENHETARHTAHRILESIYERVNERLAPRQGAAGCWSEFRVPHQYNGASDVIEIPDGTGQ